MPELDAPEEPPEEVDTAKVDPSDVPRRSELDELEAPDEPELPDELDGPAGPAANGPMSMDEQST